jgi:RNA polymerase sigma-70 factor (ECF subfamily)
MAELSEVVDRAVRGERGRIVGALLRLCGSLDAAEEAFQDAAVAALQAWGVAVPANPAAWLMTAAKHRATDARRHAAVVAAKAPLLADADAVVDTIDTVRDDYLRLIFTCCHPALATDNQIALTLKVVCGFDVDDIARAFVCGADTISQRILRAKKTIADAGVPYAEVDRGELAGRVAAVLGVVYAMFGEGHVARTGALMRLDLQAEALRLGRLVCDLVPTEPEAFGLVAIIALAAARAATRIDDAGLPVLLDAQDRARWNRAGIREGLMALQRARSLGGRGPYVVQAEIAALHVTAPRYADTDWAAIVARYDELAACAPSPIVALSRAVAVAMRDGPAAGLAALRELERPLAAHHLFYATRAELRERAGEDPRGDLARAIALVSNDAERQLLERRLRRVATAEL